MQKYAEMAMQNGVATEAAGRPSGDFCFTLRLPLLIVRDAPERVMVALPRILHGMVRTRVASGFLSMSRVIAELRKHPMPSFPPTTDD